MMRVITGLLGAIVEAWSELRVNRTRVLLSLIGVAVAVAAITGVVAVGGVLEQSQTESSERYGGRPALLSVSITDQNGISMPDAGTMDAALTRLASRYGIRYHSRVLQDQLSMTTPRGVVQSQLLAVDPSYATMHRLRPTAGRMPDQSDEAHLAPVVVVDVNTWRLLGSPPLAGHPTVSLVCDQPVTAVVIGVQRSDCDQCYSVTMLYDQFEALKGSSPSLNGSPPSWEAWVPPKSAAPLSDRFSADLGAEFGSGWSVNVNRSDYQASSNGGDPLLPLKLAVGGIAGLVLLLGALGLLNISLVTVRYRIREIGIRRSFGATAGRVFFSVMMESVVATVAAGFIGVVIAIIALKNPWSAELVGRAVQDVPPFPVSAAILGLVVSTVIGALAGLLPALVAVRVKPIDAIRY
ncbi:MAG: ABC transporter permease [Pseudolysinimonas sp.]